MSTNVTSTHYNQHIATTNVTSTMQSPQTPSTCPKSTKFNPLLSSTYKQVKHGPVTWSEPYRETETSPSLDRCSIQL